MNPSPRATPPRAFAWLAGALLLGAIALTLAPRPAGPSAAASSVSLVPSVSTLPSTKRASPAASSLPLWQHRFNRILERPFILQSELFEDLAASFADDEAVSILRSLEPAAPGTPEAIFAEALAARWAARAPADAAQWAAQLPPGDSATNFLRRILASWAERDLAAAIAWLSPLAENETKTAAALFLAREAAQRAAPRAALDLAADLAPSRERDELLAYAAQQWAAADRDAALAWTRALSDVALREQILAKIAVDWSMSDPGRAADFAAVALPRGETRDHAFAAILQAWAATAPASAAAWLERITDTALRDAAIERLTESWAKTDLAAAGAWLARLPVNFSRDTAIGIYAAVLATTGPDQARQWAESIQDADFRSRVLRHLGAR